VLIIIDPGPAQGLLHYTADDDDAFGAVLMIRTGGLRRPGHFQMHSLTAAIIIDSPDHWLGINVFPLLRIARRDSLERK
jgi:hypothetical protein